MEAVCLTCGDVGFPEAIVFCTECQACALHRYCLDGPVIFTDEVIWFCEDCEPEAKRLKTNSGNLAKIAIQSRAKLKYCVKGLKKSKQQNKKEMEEKPSKTLSSNSRCSTELEHPQSDTSHNQESESKNECGPVPTDAANSNVDPKSVQISQATATDDLIIALEGHVDAKPIADPIWRGNLIFCDKSKTIGRVNGLLAHLSNIASPKVLDEMKFFPHVLSADLLPRSEVWPNSFKEEGPTDESIALYFFPGNRRLSIKAFDKLVDDIICTEAAVRVVTENAVLLIFPSDLLPIRHQKFQTKYYLWGVFKKKQTSHETNGDVC